MPKITYRESVLKTKTDYLLSHADDYDFPQLVLNLRKLTGISRKTFYEDTGFPEITLYVYETGKFWRKPSSSKLNTISSYYGIPSDVLSSKAEQFVAKKKESFAKKNKKKCA